MAFIGVNNFIGFNSLRKPPLLNSTLTYNNNRPRTRDTVLQLLATYDTFHDFGGTRGDSGFFNTTVAKFLMLGPGFVSKTDDTNAYKDAFSNVLSGNNLNYYGPGTYENKVAALFETIAGLQKAVTTISYDDIINNMSIVSGTVSGTIQFNSAFLTKVIKSNGALNIVPSLTESMSFDKFISKYNDDKKRNIALQKIGHFIKWYLHSPNFETFNTIQEIRISADAGFFHVGKILSIANSGGIPYITVPNILDSANTSICKLDPKIDIEYELLENDIVYPIYSNYFSSDIYFMCYIVNNGKTFGVDSPFCFSLCIFNINALHEAANTVNVINEIKHIRTFGTEVATRRSALETIKLVIDSNPGMVVRYYFGEVERDLTKELAKCGTCGASVDYIGRVFSKINKADTAKPRDVVLIRNLFDELKTEGKLNGRIPISDGRIVKLFRLNPITNIYDFTHIRHLYYLLTDYKRTGDYQQIYALLSKILQDSNGNAGNYTLSTGDELSALLSRLVGLPTMWQVGSTGRTTLFRNKGFVSEAQDGTATVIARLESEVSKERAQFEIDKSVLKKFVDLRDKLNILTSHIYKIEKMETKSFSRLLLINLIFVLNGLIQTSENITPLLSALEQLQTPPPPHTVDSLTDYLTDLKNVKPTGEAFIVEIIRYFPNFVDHPAQVVSEFDAADEYFSNKYDTFIQLPLLNIKFKNAKIIIPSKVNKLMTLIDKFDTITSSNKNPLTRTQQFNKNDVELFKNLITQFFKNLECADSVVKNDFDILFDSINNPTKFDIAPLDNILSTIRSSVIVDYSENNDTVEMQFNGGGKLEKGDLVEYRGTTYKYVSGNDTLSTLETRTGTSTRRPKRVTVNTSEVSSNANRRDATKRQADNRKNTINDKRSDPRYYIQDKFKDILLVIVNKCELFIKDTLYDCSSVGGFTNNICELSFKYNSFEFCYNLLFGNDEELGLLNKITELSLSEEDMSVIDLLTKYDTDYAVRTLLYWLFDLIRSRVPNMVAIDDSDMSVVANIIKIKKIITYVDYDSIITEFIIDSEISVITSRIPTIVGDFIFNKDSSYANTLYYIEPFLFIVSIGLSFYPNAFFNELFPSEPTALTMFSPTTGINEFFVRVNTAFSSRFLTVRRHIITNKDYYNTCISTLETLSLQRQRFFSGAKPKGGLKLTRKIKRKSKNKKIKRRTTEKIVR